VQPILLPVTFLRYLGLFLRFASFFVLPTLSCDRDPVLALVGIASADIFRFFVGWSSLLSDKDDFFFPPVST
jgi:hypothetical protein